VLLSKDFQPIFHQTFSFQKWQTSIQNWDYQGMSTKSTVFWNSDPGNAMFLLNIGIDLPDYMALHPKNLLS
jgi:hypothetical protein